MKALEFLSLKDEYDISCNNGEYKIYKKGSNLYASTYNIADLDEVSYIAYEDCSFNGGAEIEIEIEDLKELMKFVKILHDIEKEAK